MKVSKVKTLVLAMALSATSSTFAGLVNINKADSEVIAHHLKGIGDKKAEAIVKYRAEYGAFTDVEHLVNVKGVGEKILSKNLEDISLSQGAVTMTDEIVSSTKKEKKVKKPVVISKEKASKKVVKPELSKKQELVRLDSEDTLSKGKKVTTKKIVGTKVKSSKETIKVEK